VSGPFFAAFPYLSAPAKASQAAYPRACATMKKEKMRKASDEIGKWNPQF
jgi:hypothetical protein